MGIDHVLNVTLLLTVLATVTERVTELLKQPFQDRFKRKYGQGSRGYELFVALVALFAACIVAGFSQTDLLWILSHSDANTWYDVGNGRNALPIFGYLLTALAIGFGSRTWHELSEQLTALKKAREAFQVDPGDGLEQKRTDVREVAAAAIEANRDQWFEKHHDLRGVSVGRKERDGIETNEIVVLFQVASKQANPEVPLPTQIVFGQYTFKTDVIESGEAVTTEHRPQDGPLALHERPIALGNSVSRTNSAAVGSLGVRVKKNDKRYVMTCFHVVCSTELHATPSQTEFDGCSLNRAIDTRCLSPGKHDHGRNDEVIGRIAQAIFAPRRGLDVALIELEDADEVANKIYRLGNAPTGIRQLGERHVHHRVGVRLCGRTSQFRNGRVLARNESRRIKYAGGIRRMNGLIRLSKMASTGDSGAAVVDIDSRVIGLVVATDERFTYAMPIASLLASLEVELDV